MSESSPGGEPCASSTDSHKELPDKIYRDEEWLRARYWGDMMDSREIADMLGRNKQTILKHLHRNDIEVRSPGQPDDLEEYSWTTDGLNDSEWLHEQYWEKGKSTYEIADDLDVTNQAVGKAMMRNDVPRRGKSERIPRGEDHPAWNGGCDTYYGSGWINTANKVRERDGNECQICQVHTDELDIDRGLDVHHIIPYRCFDDDGKANDLGNLATLCRSCHREWEGIPLMPIVE